MSFNPAIPEYIKSLMPMRRADVVKKVNAKFKTSYSKGSIDQIMHAYKIKSGLKSSGKEVPLYSEYTINEHGREYVLIKTKKGWVLKHHFVWKQANGRIPRNTHFVFLNGNALDCTLENLELVSIKVFAIMSRNHLFSNNPEVTRAGLAIAKHRAAIYEMARKTKDGERIVRKIYNDKYHQKKKEEAV